MALLALEASDLEGEIVNSASLTIILGIIIRHSLSAIGVSGLLDASDTNNLIAAAVTLVGIGLSLWQKRDQLKSL